MGGKKSKQSSVYEKPWRDVSWRPETVTEVLNYVKKFQPERRDVKQIRVLLYGPVLAGKSSFISSVANIIKGKHVACASSNANSNKSFTRRLKVHTLLKSDGSRCSFVLCDIMGLEEGDGSGVHVDNIKLAIKGHMKDKYQCNASSPLSDKNEGYNPDPAPSEKVHVVVCVVSSNATEITSSILDQIKEIRRTAEDFGIPQVLICTKIDEFCEETDKDLKNVYYSKSLHQKMKEISTATGFPLNCILPVKNYCEILEPTDNDMNALILNAVKVILDFGDDFVSKMEE